MSKLHTIVLCALTVLFNFHTTNTCDLVVPIAPPDELEKYLTEEKTDNELDACSLCKNFSTDDIEPFITALAAMPSDVNGYTAKDMVYLLVYWAHTAGGIDDKNDDKNKRLDAIKFCIEKIADLDAHEELSYWYQKWLGPFEIKNIKNIDTELDEPDPKDLPVPQELYPHMKKGEKWLMLKEFSLDDIPNFIFLLASLSPQKYSACARIGAMSHALFTLSWWTTTLEFPQKGLSAIKNGIGELSSPSARQELLYWFHKNLSRNLLAVNDHQNFTLFLKNGAYIKSCDIGGHTLFFHPCLDEALYQKLKKNGLDPEQKAADGNRPIHRAIYLSADSAFDTLLRHGAKIHGRGESGNTAVIAAIGANNSHALRSLLQHGIIIDQAANEKQTPLDYLIDINTKKMLPQPVYLYLLLGQQPRELSNPPQKYLDFLKIGKYNGTKEQRKKLKDWLYLHAKYKEGTLPNPLIFFSNQQQLKDGVMLFIKNRVHCTQMTRKTLSPSDQCAAKYYAEMCAIALAYSAKNFFTLLSLCAQEHAVELKSTLAGYTITLNDWVTTDEKLQEKFAQSIEKYLKYYQKDLIHAAFAPVFFQDNLYKIVSWDVKKYGRPNELPGTKKALQEIQDLKVIFN